MTEKQRGALARHLATLDFMGLAERGAEPANGFGRRVRVAFGTKSSNLGAFSLDGLADKAPEADWSRFVVLTLVLEDMFKRTKVDRKKISSATARAI